MESVAVVAKHRGEPSDRPYEPPMPSPDGAGPDVPNPPTEDGDGGTGGGNG
ncbi:hypothetical protein GCM10022245_15020 [Streptomyces mayteni]